MDSVGCIYIFKYICMCVIIKKKNPINVKGGGVGWIRVREVKEEVK